MQGSPDIEAAAFVLDEVVGYLVPAALRAAAVTGVADHLRNGPRPVAELAAATGATEAGLHRVLRLLATRGIFTEAAPGVFALTPPAAALTTDAPHPVRAAVLMMTDPAMWRSAGEVAESTLDGKPAFDRIFGAPLFDHYARNPEAVAAFNDGMAQYSGLENDPVAAACTVPPDAHVVDLAGGQGGLLCAVLRRHPTATGTLFDLPHVLPGNVLAADPAVTGRWRLEPGDFRTEVPPADVYLIKRILHDWDDDTCVRLLRTCAAAARPGARILVIDPVLPEGDTPHQAKAVDLLMMTVMPGHERTAAQFERLLATAGLRLTRIIDIPAMPVSVLEAVISTTG
ncbi:methyltransferase [Actinoplanes sp. RD1]|uniref:methyltransferase n=1 Tax=Actinoplanes sp. RD1 TaxID=3064538 RepID=UPI0027406B9D|nr:methyltransferase [Actinoplanes sp. RD1]